MSFAVMFSGQGMQHADMLPWLTDDDTVRATCVALSIRDWRTQLRDIEWAARNANAQTLLTGLNLAAWTQLAQALPPPAAVAGYSVGELAGFAAAGVFDARTALALADARARAMDRCAAVLAGGLVAVSGLSRIRIEQLCIDTGVALAIDNGSHAAVLGGNDDSLAAAIRDAQIAGAHCTRLAVSVASHTALMKAAADEFAQTLTGFVLNTPRLQLIANAARITTAVDAAHALVWQIAHTLRWSTYMDLIHARRIRCVLEVGPASALARMWNERFPDVPARSVDEFRSLSAVVTWVLRHAAE